MRTGFLPVVFDTAYPYPAEADDAARRMSGRIIRFGTNVPEGELRNQTYSFQRSSGRQKPSLGVFQASVGRNSAPGVRRLAVMASKFRSTPRPGLSGTAV